MQVDIFMTSLYDRTDCVGTGVLRRPRVGRPFEVINRQIYESILKTFKSRNLKYDI